ncbi:MAG: hypothetical protein II659_01085 [Bacteroidales bacterium]|nr:hypothetical protein [Bacteroidales bacterium]
MADYVKRENVLNDLVKVVCEHGFSRMCEYYVRSALMNIPAEDVAPVVRGNYVIDEFGDATCSVCGAEFLDSTRKYCPDCGAFLTRESEDG